MTLGDVIGALMIGTLLAICGYVALGLAAAILLQPPVAIAFAVLIALGALAQRGGW